jgi:ubiquinone/menaquinone biosynthesis C-methylase UbiE
MISSRRRTGGGSEEIRSAFSIFVASIDELPYGDGIFDAVISSLMFHHLPLRIKKRGLEEVYRVLKPGEGGSCYVTSALRVISCFPSPI